MGDWERRLTDDETRTVARARRTAHTLYDGTVTPHRSCGIAMAETFGQETVPYQALRRGGISGMGACGIAVSGRLILGAVLGDPDPTGAVTPALQVAMAEFDQRLPERLKQQSCNELTAGFESFKGPERHGHCTRLAAEVAALVAEVLLRNGVQPDVPEGWS